MKAKIPTISDVARHAGVSHMTVSRVINGESNVSATTRRNVLESIEALNYVPNVSARALAGARAYKLALLYANPSAFYLSELLVGALEAISKRGHQLLVQKVNEDSSADRIVQDLSDALGDFDGIIAPPPLSDYGVVRDFLVEHDFPAVFLSGADGRGRSSKVCIDDYAAAKDLTGHLISLGHERIGFIKGHPNQHSSKERLRGYRDALSEAGLKSEPKLIAQGYFTYESGLKAARTLLGLSDTPTAIFASNDDMAAAALAVAASQGLSVPENISVAGFDDSPLASAAFPRLTTVKQPLGEMASAAVDSLIDLVSRKAGRHEADEKRIVFDYRIIHGGSTAAPPGRERAGKL